MKHWSQSAIGCLWLAAAAADETSAPQAIALNCQTCHQSPDGETGIADLSKLSREELRQALLELKTSPKPEVTIMPRLIKGYSDQQLQAVADFLTVK